MSTATLMSAEQLLRMPVYRSPADIQTLMGDAELDGGDLLPGFRCPIADLFVNP